jgi:hypothetical protein
LALQILSRYSAWLNTTLAGLKGDADDDAALKFAGAAVADMDALRARIADNALLASLGEFTVALDATPFADRIIGVLERRCAEGVKAVRSLASQVRAAPPKSGAAGTTTSPSYFIPSLLKPMHAFFDARPQLAAQHRAAWAAAVVAHVLAQYAAILSQVRKTEDLVRRHRKSKRPGFSLFGASASASADDGADEDARFRAQMATDADALAADARTLGVDVDTLPAWAELREVVERPPE